jgi:DNA-binding NtrC family response regulator
MSPPEADKVKQIKTLRGGLLGTPHKRYRRLICRRRRKGPFPDVNWLYIGHQSQRRKTMPQRILIIDDEPDMLMLLRMMIEENTDYEVETTNNPSEGIKLFSEKDYDLVITDLKMPGLDGIELFDEFQEIKPDIPVVMITAYGSIETADEAMKKGIADFITKPFRKDSILFTINRAIELARVKKENIELKKKLDKE